MAKLDPIVVQLRSAPLITIECTLMERARARLWCFDGHEESVSISVSPTALDEVVPVTVVSDGWRTLGVFDPTGEASILTLRSGTHLLTRQSASEWRDKINKLLEEA